MEVLSRRVINVCSPFLFTSRIAAQKHVSWLTCLSTHLSHVRAINKKVCAIGVPKMQRIRRYPPSIFKPFARNKSTARTEGSKAAGPSVRHFRLTHKNLHLRRSRFLTGAMSGIVGTARTMISEVCGSEHEAVGMSFFAGDAIAELQ